MNMNVKAISIYFKEQTDLDDLDKAIEVINKSDIFGGTLTRSAFVRMAALEGARGILIGKVNEDKKRKDSMARQQQV